MPQAVWPGLLHPESLPLQQTTPDPYCAGGTQTQFWLSLCGVSGSWCTQGFVWAFWASLAVWGLILNVISPSWIDAFELWCWRRLLRAPWTARKSNQLILNEISVEYSLEGLMLKLKLQYFGHMMQRTDWPQCCKKLKAGGEGDNRGWDGWMVSLTQWILVWASFGSWWRTGRPGVLQPMGWQGIRQNWVTELTDWSIFILQFRLFVWIFLMLTFLCFTVFTLV